MIKSALARVIYPCGSIRTVLRGPLRGTRFVVRPGMGATYALGSASYGFEWFAGKIRAGQTVFDIGANRGQMALYFSRLVGPAGRVVAFEPVPDVYADLVRNVSINCCSNVEPINSAVSDMNGTARFAYAAEHSMQGKLTSCEKTYTVSGSEEIDVALVTLDAIVDRMGRAPDFLKIDVEGAAALVIEGAREVLDRCAPVIYMELHGPDEQRGAARLMNDFGYELRTLNGTLVTDSVAHWVSPLAAMKPHKDAPPAKSPALGKNP